MKTYFFECLNDYPGQYRIEAVNDLHAVSIATKKSIEVGKELRYVYDAGMNLIFQAEITLE